MLVGILNKIMLNVYKHIAIKKVTSAIDYAS